MAENKEQNTDELALVEAISGMENDFHARDWVDYAKEYHTRKLAEETPRIQLELLREITQEPNESLENGISCITYLLMITDRVCAKRKQLEGE